jgi:hypothetical protein
LSHFLKSEINWANKLEIFNAAAYAEVPTMRQESWVNAVILVIRAGESEFECSHETVQMAIAILCVFARHLEQPEDEQDDPEEEGRNLVIAAMVCLMISSKLNDYGNLTPHNLQQVFISTDFNFGGQEVKIEPSFEEITMCEINIILTI